MNDARAIAYSEVQDVISSSVIEYALAVNCARAIASVADGLKPVHRRILYVADNYRSYTKSAKVVGDVMGNFHPHGDSAIYEALVRMTQNFVVFAPTLTGYGSWGTVDGDPPAAMRYTEVMINNVGSAFMTDIADDAVDFIPTFDNRNVEPLHLPVPFPYIFMAGCYGIAVGFTNNIPTHHPSAVCRAAIAKLANPELNDYELFDLMPPAFPTGGIVTNTLEVREAYARGGGKITIASRVSITDQGILIQGVPYYTTTASLMRSIQKTTEGKTPSIPEISEIQNIDNATVLVTLKRGSDANSVVQRLYKHTECMVSKTLEFTAVNTRGYIEPRYTPAAMMAEWLSWRHATLTRIHKFKSQKLRREIHVRDGIATILTMGVKLYTDILHSSDTEETARRELHRVFNLDDTQIDHLLRMQTRSLIRANLTKLHEEIMRLHETLARHQSRIENPQLVSNDMAAELDMWAKYFDSNTPPNTTVYQNWGVVDILDVPREDVLILVTNSHGIRRMEHAITTQRRGGRGVGLGRLDGNDAPREILSCTTHDVLIFFTSTGRLFVKNVYDLPEQTKNNKPIPLDNMLQLTPGETVCKVLVVDQKWSENPNTYLVMATAGGYVKRVACSEYRNVNASGIRAISLQRGDTLVGAELLDPSTGYTTVVIYCAGDIAATGSMCIRFDYGDIRASARISGGVNGIVIDPATRRDCVAGMFLAPASSREHFVFAVTSNGYGKLTPLDEYDIQSRGGKGRIMCAKQPGTHVASAHLVTTDQLAIIVSNAKMIAIPIEQVRIQGRATLGVKLMDVGDGERVCATVCTSVVHT
jgi:DNA gyrase subunit A